MFDGIEFRGFSQRMVANCGRESEFSGVPVWNGLTDERHHPTQRC